MTALSALIVLVAVMLHSECLYKEFVCKLVYYFKISFIPKDDIFIIGNIVISDFLGNKGTVNFTTGWGRKW